MTKLLKLLFARLSLALVLGLTFMLSTACQDFAPDARETTFYIDSYEVAVIREADNADFFIVDYYDQDLNFLARITHPFKSLPSFPGGLSRDESFGHYFTGQSSLIDDTQYAVVVGAKTGEVAYCDLGAYYPDNCLASSKDYVFIASSALSTEVQITRISKVDGTAVQAGFPDGHIVHLAAYEDGLLAVQEIEVSVDGFPYACQSRVLILDMDLNIIKTIDCDGLGGRLFWTNSLSAPIDDKYYFGIHRFVEPVQGEGLWIESNLCVFSPKTKELLTIPENDGSYHTRDIVASGQYLYLMQWMEEFFVGRIKIIDSKTLEVVGIYELPVQLCQIQGYAHNGDLYIVGTDESFQVLMMRLTPRDNTLDFLGSTDLTFGVSNNSKDKQRLHVVGVFFSNN